LYTKGPTVLSPSVATEVIVLEDADGAQRSWIGDFEGSTEASSLHLTAPEGKVAIAFSDEQLVNPAVQNQIVPSNPSEPVHDPDVGACPRGLVSWIIKSIERRLAFPDVKIEMKILKGSDAAVVDPPRASGCSWSRS
jgi:hypothetical protein